MIVDTRTRSAYDHYIDESGYLYLKSLGGLDPNLLPGLRVDIWHDGKPLRGIIGKNAPHMSRGGAMLTKLKMEDIWVDIGAKDKEDAQKRVAVGDIITFCSQIEELSENAIVSKQLIIKSRYMLRRR